VKVMFWFRWFWLVKVERGRISRQSAADNEYILQMKIYLFFQDELSRQLSKGVPTFIRLGQGRSSTHLKARSHWFIKVGDYHSSGTRTVNIESLLINLVLNLLQRS
jgi:hypothetical protein